MQSEFESNWRAARTYENRGNLEAAKKIYDVLIRADPERLYVRLRLSALEQSFGNYRGSHDHALRAAETVRKGRWADLAPVAQRLLVFGEQDAVHALILQADWNSAEVLRSSAALTQYLWLTGRVEDALRLIDVAQARAPSSHLLSYSRANALRYLGRMEEATGEYERCLQLKPDYASAHWSLAHHARAAFPGRRVDRIRQAQKAYATDAPEQPYLHYALFKEYDNAGEFDAAWRHLQSGAACKRRTTPYNSAREQQGFDALQQLFAGHPIRHEPVPDDSGRVPIFIVGMPRSGTTLLERIIGSHAGVSSGGELTDFNDALSWESNRFLEASISAAAVDRLGTIDFPGVGRRYSQRTEARANGNAFLTDKNPLNFVNAGFIGRALPSARVLCLRRAPMDACFSNLKELFSNQSYGYSYVLDELADHYLRFVRLCELWQQVMPDRFMVVDYEALVSDPQATAARALAFCGIRFDPASIDITRNKAPVATASSSQVRQPINTRGIDAWRPYAAHLAPLRERLGKSS